MKVIKNIFILLIISVFATQYIGCKKKKSDPSNTQVLSTAWKIESVIVNDVAADIADYSAYRLTFTTEGTYTLIDGNGTTTGTWAFNSNETAILVDTGTTNEYTMSLLELTGSKLTIEFTISGNFKTADELNNWVMIPA